MKITRGLYGYSVVLELQEKDEVLVRTRKNDDSFGVKLSLEAGLLVIRDVGGVISSISGTNMPTVVDGSAFSTDDWQVCIFFGVSVSIPVLCPFSATTVVYLDISQEGRVGITGGASIIKRIEGRHECYKEV